MEANYSCAVTVQEIKDYIGRNKVVAFDFETAPDDAYRGDDKAALDPARAHITGCSFSVGEGSGIYVPVTHRIGVNIDEEDFMHFLAKFLSDDEIIKVAHNMAFEAAIAYAAGIVIIPPVYDTICASQMSLKSPYEFRKLNDSGLKKLAEELCGEPLPSFSKVTGGGHFDELNAQDPETVRYGSADSDFAIRLYHMFNAWFDAYLPEHRRIVERIESPTSVYIGIMKTNGIPVDTDLMEARRTEAVAKQRMIREQIQDMTGGIDIGANCSTVAFKDYLYNGLGLPVMKETDSGKPAADDAAMNRLKEWCDVNRPELSGLFALVQEYRKLGKLISTYIDGYLKYVNPVTRKIHPEMFSLSTETGRMNCQRPNLQNMPRQASAPVSVRDFVKASEGHIIVSCDYSQIELRVGAFYCRDKVMMETYKEGGDIHAATTGAIFGVSYEEALDKHRAEYKEQRTIAKNVNFGAFYGLFAKGLQRTLKVKAGLDKSVDECQAILDSLKQGYQQLTSWQAETKADARRRLYTRTWFGRRRYLPAIASRDWKARSFAERCALNTPIQGTAAEILKLSMAKILRGLPERPWLRPILQIHDELTFIVPEERLTEAVVFIKKCMDEKPFPEFDLPLIAEASAGKTFGCMEELEE